MYIDLTLAPRWPQCWRRSSKSPQRPSATSGRTRPGSGTPRPFGTLPLMACHSQISKWRHRHLLLPLHEWQPRWGHWFRTERHLCICIHHCIICKREQVLRRPGTCIKTSHIDLGLTERHATKSYWCTIFLGQEGGQFRRLSSKRKTFCDNSTNNCSWRGLCWWPQQPQSHWTTACASKSTASDIQKLHRESPYDLTRSSCPRHWAPGRTVSRPSLNSAPVIYCTRLLHHRDSFVCSTLVFKNQLFELANFLCGEMIPFSWIVTN